MNANNQEWETSLKEWLEKFKKQLDKNSDYLQKYQQAYQTYQSQFTELEKQAFDLLNIKLREFYSEGNRVQSLDQIYEIWLDCCTAIHEKMIATKGYQHLYGHLINSFLAWAQYAKADVVN